MVSRELMEKVKSLEQVGVLRALLFLREGTKTTREFENIMSLPTWTRGARQILLEMGLIEIEEGIRQRMNHSLTEKGKRVSDLLEQWLSLI